MTSPDHPRTSRSIAVYATAWLTATAVIVVLFVAARPRDAPTVGVPPLQATRLGVAARRAGCQLLGPHRAARAHLPVTGPALAAATRAGVYDRPQPAESVLAAIRRGTVVFEFRGGLPDGSLNELKTAQALVPEGTILAPSGTAIPYVVVARAYRHALGCPRFTQRTLDALRLFRGRFLGTGPEGD